MTDRPILFSAPMVRALLDGRKTQTRRVLTKPYGVLERLGDGWRPVCTKFFPGDRLWVRETWTARMKHGWTIRDARSRMFSEQILYRADGGNSIDGWWSSIHMPREFSRLTLIVTEVRVQRLQDISSADAIAEGCPALANSATIDCETPDPRDSFRTLWDSLNASRGYGWDGNPWVVAVSFAVHAQNIDQLERG